MHTQLVGDVAVNVDNVLKVSCARAHDCTVSAFIIAGKFIVYLAGFVHN